MEIDSVTSYTIQRNRRIRHAVQNYVFSWYSVRTDITYCHKCVSNTFDGSHPNVSRNYQNKLGSVKKNLIYSLITIRLATCFDPTGSSSGLLYKPINVRKLRTSLRSQQCLQRSWRMCTSFNLLDCLHKCMKNIPYKTPCKIWSPWW
jgi:hypothetical protein